MLIFTSLYLEAEMSRLYIQYTFKIDGTSSNKGPDNQTQNRNSLAEYIREIKHYYFFNKLVFLKLFQINMHAWNLAFISSLLKLQIVYKYLKINDFIIKWNSPHHSVNWEDPRSQNMVCRWDCRNILKTKRYNGEPGDEKKDQSRNNFQKGASRKHRLLVLTLYCHTILGWIEQEFL